MFGHVLHIALIIHEILELIGFDWVSSDTPIRRKNGKVVI